MMRACKDCEAYFPLPKKTKEGECRQRPPASSFDGAMIMCGAPTVAEDFWCLQFVEKGLAMETKVIAPRGRSKKENP